MRIRSRSQALTGRPWLVPLFAGALATALVASVAIGTTASAGVGAARHEAVVAKKGPVETEKSPVGKILVDKKGRTVYLFMADKPGVSNCTGQ